MAVLAHDHAVAVRDESMSSAFSAQFEPLLSPDSAGHPLLGTSLQVNS